MPRRVPVHNLDPTGASEGDAIVVVGGKFTTGPVAGTGGLVPLVGTLGGGDPGLIWTDDDQLVFVEV